MPMRPIRVLFVHNAPQRFVIVDRDLLAEAFVVEEHIEQSPRRLNPARVLAAVRRNDVVFGWFASWHTALPVQLAAMVGKPSILVVGGYDTAQRAGTGYGDGRRGVRGWLGRRLMQQATALLVNSDSARAEALAFSGVDAAKVTRIYHGFDAFTADMTAERPSLALTVGGVLAHNLHRKGLLPFVQAAAHLPTWDFHVVGAWLDGSVTTLRRVAPPNVTLAGYLDQHALHARYAQASVYVQASLHEGFGMSVAEAMLAGCIPVVSRAGALPEVVGDVGVLLDALDPAIIAAGVQQAANLGVAARQRARERVLDLFDMGVRRAALHALVRQVVAS